MPTGILIIIFIAVTLGFAAVFLLVSGKGDDVHERARRRLGIGSAAPGTDASVAAASVLKKEILEQRRKKHRPLLSKLDGLTGMLEKSGCGIKTNAFVTITLCMAAVAGGTTYVANGSIPSAFVAAAVFGVIPYAYVRIKMKRRIKLLTEQFPDALEMLTNTMRAGQAFTTGLMTVAEEMPDPIASEFRITFEEQNYGAGMGEALTHLAERVGTMDIDFFVTAVNIQRETGGNLAEILDNLGKTIRQRFRILGHVRTLTAQGRLSGFIVGLMPLGLGVLLTILNPDYMGQLFSSPLGKMLLGMSFGMQLMGFLWINKIVKIKV